MTRSPRGFADGLGAALALCALLVVFFWSALVRFGEVYYSSADISRGSSLTAVGGLSPPSNQILSDPVVQMEPWTRLAREEIEAGRLPLWNPWNAGGMPLFANLQSALLSPFTLPHYLLPERAALLVAAFLKLFCAGFATFLLLRKLGVTSSAALVGGVIYAFAGHNVLLLGFPHSGVSALMPVALLCVEAARERFVASGRLGRDVVSRLALLSLAVCACVLAGHPEACVFALVFVVSFAAWRTIASGVRARAAWKLGCGFVSSLLAGIALAAVQIVPFAEYLVHSSAWSGRGGGSMPLWSSIWSLLFFPDLGGNPSKSYRVAEVVPPPNYETANIVYVGSLALFLALVALSAVRRRPEVRFFVIALVAWILYAYDRGFGRLVTRVPLLSALPPNRSQLIGQFAIACASAFALDELFSSPISPRRAWRWAIAGTALLVTFLVEARLDLGVLLADYPASAALIRAGSSSHMAFVVATFALGVSAACAGCLSTSRALRAACAAAIVLASFAQTGWLWRGYNPVCADRYFHPRTEAIDQLARTVGDDPFVIVGANTIPPSENAIQRLRMVSGYDALWNARYDRLACAAFGDAGNWRLTRRAEEADLVRFGVRWVLTLSHWPPIGTLLGDLPPAKANAFTTAEIVEGMEVEQRIAVGFEAIDAIVLRFRAEDRHKSCRVRFEVLDDRTGESLATEEIEAHDLVPDVRGSALHVVRLDPVRAVCDRALTVRISSPDARAGEAVALSARRDLAAWVDDGFRRQRERAARNPALQRSSTRPSSNDWRLEQGRSSLAGGLQLDLSSAWSKLEPVAEIGDFHVLRLAGARGRFRCVAHAVAARDADDAARRVLEGELDPRTEVVLEGASAAVMADLSSAGPLAWNVARLAETPTRIELDVTCDRAACLVTTLAAYPGWRVEVNGAARELLRADSAFLAVALQPGTSRVAFVYAPESLVVGAWISLAALIALAAWIALAPPRTGL